MKLLEHYRPGRYPFHAPLTHMPIGLWVCVPGWDLLAFFTGRNEFWQISYYTMLAGLLFAGLAVFAGFLDFALMVRSRPAMKTAILHIVVMLLAVALYGSSFWLRASNGPMAGASAPAAALSALGFFALLAGGALGGELVLHHGIGTAWLEETQGAPPEKG